MIGAIYLTKDFLVELMHQFIAWLPNNGRGADRNLDEFCFTLPQSKEMF